MHLPDVLHIISSGYLYRKTKFKFKRKIIQNLSKIFVRPPLPLFFFNQNSKNILYLSSTFNFSETCFLTSSCILLISSSVNDLSILLYAILKQFDVLPVLGWVKSSINFTSSTKSPATPRTTSHKLFSVKDSDSQNAISL